MRPELEIGVEDGSTRERRPGSSGALASGQRQQVRIRRKHPAFTFERI